MKLLIRSANHKQPDFMMPIEDTVKTVLDVKQYLSQNYPDNPDKSFMRMIFQGHLLADEKLVADIFNTDQDCYVVHLVCLPRIKTDPAATSPTPAPVQNGPVSDPPAARPPPTAPLTTDPNTNRESASVGNNNPPVDTSSRPTVTNTPQTTFSTVSIDWQQLSGLPRSDIAFTEWYARYYAAWLVYLSALQAQAMGVPNAEILRLQSQFSANAYSVAAAAPDVAAGADNGNADPAPPARAPDNRGINAAAGPLFDEDDEEGRARDLLDWVYVAVRAGILLSLIYLYSSIPRIVALIAMLGSVWILRAALGGLQQNNNGVQRQPQQQQVDRQPQQENAAQPPGPQNPENTETPAAAATEGNPMPPATDQANNVQPAQPPAPAPVPTYRLIFSAIAGFFLSLFPDAPGLQHLD